MLFHFQEDLWSWRSYRVRGGISRTQTSAAFSFMWSVREKNNQGNMKVKSSGGGKVGSGKLEEK